MKKVLFYLLFILCIPLIQSCTFNNITINNETDNKDGKAFLDRFYGDIAKADFSSLNTMISDSLKVVAGPDGVGKLAELINRKVGKYKSYVIDDHYIKTVTGSTNGVSYNYKLKVTYEKGVVDEIIGLNKHDNSSITMNSYHANSDLLVK